jgi:hypothetical protein
VGGEEEELMKQETDIPLRWGKNKEGECGRTEK